MAFRRQIRVLTVLVFSIAVFAIAGSALAMTAKPSITTFTPASGKGGGKVTISGKNLTGVSSVKLGSLSASFSAGSATKITFTVPTKAKTGKITVKTKGGTATSSKSFTVA